MDKSQVNKLQDIILSGLLGLLLPPIAGGGLAMWSWLIGWSGPLVVLVFIGGYGLMLFASNQSHTQRERMLKVMSQLPDKDVEALIRQWLSVAGYSIRNDTQASSAFQFVVEDVISKVPITIARPNAIHSMIILATKVNMGNEEVAMLNALGESSYRRFISDLRCELLRFGCEYEGLDYPLQAVTIISTLPCDNSLTEHAILSQVGFIKKARFLLSELFTECTRIT